MSVWEAHALKYAGYTDRPRAHSFMIDADPGATHSIDYFTWLLRRGDETILIDTGFDEAEAQARKRPIRLDARAMLAPFGLRPEDVTTVVLTHLHYDHAGGLHLYPNATVHMQAAEMAYAAGPCMAHAALRAPFTADHVCEAIRRLYSGKMVFHTGDAEIADGVTAHHIGGHTQGMQCLRVRTEAGWLVIASDASHFYDNFARRIPFPIVVDVEAMLNGFATLERLASRRELIVPGHDPRVMQAFPRDRADHIVRLDRGPTGEVFA